MTEFLIIFLFSFVAGCLLFWAVVRIVSLFHGE